MLPPDVILHNGKIITLDRASRVAQAIAVRSGHIAAVGDDSELCKEAAPTTQLIDLAGRSVLPGFFDGKVSRRAAASRSPAFTPWPISSAS
jgi:predicted amidohydrolase YtcJ